jgi:hypothetical protein
MRRRARNERLQRTRICESAPRMLTRMNPPPSNSDAGMLDVIGFDTATPNLIADFVRG